MEYVRGLVSNVYVLSVAPPLLYFIITLFSTFGEVKINFKGNYFEKLNVST